MDVSKRMLIMVALFGFTISNVSAYNTVDLKSEVVLVNNCAQEPKKTTGGVETGAANVLGAKLDKQVNKLKCTKKCSSSVDIESCKNALVLVLVVCYFAWPVYAWYNGLPLIPAKSSRP